MKARFSVPVLVLALGLLPTVAWAGDTYKVDPVHSTVFFKVKHAGVGYVYGRFTNFAGTLSFDDANPADSSIAVNVNAASVDSGNANRDKHLKSPDFFNVKEFPEITFKSTGIKKVDDHNYELTGDLTLLGVTKPITAKIERVGTASIPRLGDRTGIEAVFTIKRLDYGMKFMPEALGDEVTVTAALEGTK
jgi:polyisoprenoid-binding protein YceI